MGLPCAGMRDDRQSRQLLRKLRSSGAVAGYPHAQAYRYAQAGDGNTDEKAHADPYKKTYSHAHQKAHANPEAGFFGRKLHNIWNISADRRRL